MITVASPPGGIGLERRAVAHQQVPHRRHNDPKRRTDTARHHAPNQALFHREQIVDHFRVHSKGVKSYWTNPYYESSKYVGGPGSPSLLIAGGEGVLRHGMLYPFVT
jgi:hypothetical protein